MESLLKMMGQKDGGMGQAWMREYPSIIFHLPGLQNFGLCAKT